MQGQVPQGPGRDCVQIWIRYGQARVKKFATDLLILGCLWLTGCSFQEKADNSVSGTIEIDQAGVASRYGGRVVQITAREGEELKPGQPVVVLEAPELRERLAQLQATLAELKAGSRKEELAAAHADWEALKAELEFARQEEKRLRAITETGAASVSDSDRATARVSALEKSAAAAQSRHELLQAGTRPERIAQAEAQIAELETQARDLVITAPTNAVLEVLHVKLGDIAAPGRPVATLVYPGDLWVRVYVPAPWLGSIKIGQKVSVQVDSHPGKEFSGEVIQIARSAEFTPRNVQTVEERVKQVFGVKIRLPSESGELRAGMATDVRFPFNSKQ